MKYNFYSTGNRIRKRRKQIGYTQEQLAEKIETYGGNVERPNISRYENGVQEKWETIKLYNLIALCDALDTDVGHILGEYEANNHLVRDISEFTGLSPRAIEYLHYAAKEEKQGAVSDTQEHNRRTVSFINRILERYDPPYEDEECEDEEKEWGIQSVETIFSLMEDYVCSTGAFVEDKRTGEPITAITVNYGNAAPAAMVTVREFLSGQLMEMIRRSLDAIRAEHDAFADQ